MAEQGPGGSRLHEAPTAPAGWYPDPHGGGHEVYWDGSAWTTQTRQPPAPGSPKRVERSPRFLIGEKLVIAGAIALAVSPLFTWVNVVLLGSLNLFQLLRETGHGAMIAWGALIVGVAVAFLTYQDRGASTRRWLGLAAGAGAGVLALYGLASLRNDIRASAGFATLGIGPYIAIAGCLAMIVGALLPEQSEKSG